MVRININRCVTECTQSIVWYVVCGPLFIKVTMNRSEAHSLLIFLLKHDRSFVFILFKKKKKKSS